MKKLKIGASKKNPKVQVMQVMQMCCLILVSNFEKVGFLWEMCILGDKTSCMNFSSKDTHTSIQTGLHGCF